MRQVQRQRVPVHLAGQSFTPRSKDISAQRSVNLYPELNESAEHTTAMLGTPGLTLRNGDMGGEGRGLHVMGSSLYAVVGGTAYKIDAAWNDTSLGTVSGSGTVSMTDNGTQLTIATGVDSFVATSSTVAKITDSDYNSANSVTTIDSYTLFNRVNSGQFFFSAIGDSDDIDALDFATAEKAPDDSVAVLSNYDTFWIAGTRTIENWQNDGTTPFSRIPGNTVQKGVRAPHTFQLHDNSANFLGDDGMVYRLAGGPAYTHISTTAIDHQLSKCSNLSNAHAWSYASGGHDFYGINVPGECTWVYDSATKVWHQRKSYGQADWRIRHITRFNGQLVGLSDTGSLYTLHDDVYTEAGTEIERIRACRALEFDGQEFSVYRFEVIVETGAADVSETPVMWLEVSGDRGRTFTAPKMASVGKQGQYNKVVFWGPLGRFDSFLPVLKMTDDHPATWVQAWADIEVYRGR